MLTAEEKEQYAEEHFKFIRYLANRRFTGFDFDEVEGAATIGFVKALNSFDRSRGYKFTSFAGRCINYEIIRYYQTSARRKMEVSSYDIEIGENTPLLEILITENGKDYDWDYIRFVYEKTLESVSTRNQEIYNLYLQGMFQKDIAKHIGFSFGTVVKVLGDINRLMKKNYWEWIDK